MPHKCHGNGGNCPSRGHPVWELPINELDRRDDPDFDENLTGCHLVSSCSNIYHKDQFRRMLQHNFDRHYATNRAPLSLSFDASWLKINKGFLDVLDEWMDHVLLTFNDVYFVTEVQVNISQDLHHQIMLTNHPMFSGDSVDAEPHQHPGTERLPGVEGEMPGEGSAPVFSAQPLSPGNQGAARRDSQTSHLHGVSQELSLDPRPHG